MVKQIYVALLLLVSSMVYGAVETRTVDVEATGLNREQATFSALADAVAQVRGAEISASRQVRSVLTRYSQRSSSGFQAETDIQKASSNSVNVVAEGIISSYSVLSVSTPSEQGVTVRLKVDIPVYKTPGNNTDGRWRVAVYPVSTNFSSYELGSITLSDSEVSARTTQGIIEALVQSRRFAILARDKEQAIVKERSRMSGDNVSVVEKAMLGNEIGAEYVISAEIIDFYLWQKEVESRLTGERSINQEGVLTLETRVLAPATGVIVWSNTFTFPLEQLTPELNGSPSSIQKIFERAGQEVALSVIDVVWPPLVESHAAGEVVMNMGGSLIQPGQLWTAYELGDTVKNHHTNNSLGRLESKVAVIEVMRSTPTMAYGRLVQGTLGDKDYVLRRSEASAQYNNTNTQGTRDRVCLPMDPCY